MTTRETITARLYALSWQGTTHELTATSARELAAQVQAITDSRQAAGLARAAWGDDQADLQLAGVRLVAVGQVVRQVWRSLPAATRPRAAVPAAVPKAGGNAEAPAQLQSQRSADDRRAFTRAPRVPPRQAAPVRNGGDQDAQPWQDDF